MLCLLELYYLHWLIITIFSFQISTNLSYIYIKFYHTCSFTCFSLILILIYNLHAVTKLATLLSNKSSLITSNWSPYLNLGAVFSFSLFSATLLATNYAYNAASCATAPFGYFYSYDSMWILMMVVIVWKKIKYIVIKKRASTSLTLRLVFQTQCNFYKS